MEKKIMREEALSLEGDGIISKIYNLLSCKDPLFGIMPTIFLPDTIIFTFNIAERWFFGNERGVKRKLKANLTMENIEKVFLKNIPKHGIVAQYIVFDTNSNAESPSVTIIYINKDNFKSFLHGTKPNGMLQKFVTPKSENNFVIKLNWSPNFAIYEKFENMKPLNDEKLDLYQRSVTLEGKDYQVRKAPVRGHTLPHKLGKLGYNISQHIKNATGENIQISRMSLIFKIDEAGTLWFLFCTSLRIQPFDDQIEENERIFGNAIKPENTSVSITSPMNGNPQSLLAFKGISFQKKNTCQSCEKGIDDQGTVLIALSQVINAFNANRRIHNAENTKLQQKPAKRYGVINLITPKAEEINVIDPTIPKIVTKLYPDITQKSYEALKKEPGFLYQQIKVCEDCYLVLSRSYNNVKELDVIMREFETFNPKGTGKLRPETLHQRRTATATNLRGIRSNQESMMMRNQGLYTSGYDDENNSSMREKSQPTLQSPKSMPSSGRLEQKLLKRILHINDSPPKITEENSPNKSQIEYINPTHIITNSTDQSNVNLPHRISLANTAYNVLPITKTRKLQTQSSEPYFKNCYIDKKIQSRDQTTMDSMLPSLSTANATKNLIEFNSREITPSHNSDVRKPLTVHPLLRPSQMTFFKKVANVKHMDKVAKKEKLNSFDVMLEDFTTDVRSKNLKGYKLS